jgi:C_GCAxxG_C_C family probable redox protein
VLAVGEHLWGKPDDQILRMTSALAGGVGGTRKELCGALSGGVLIIGALYGRTQPDVDDSYCLDVAAQFRESFAQEFGSTICGDLRESGYGPDSEWPCSVLVERAARMLLDML